MATDRISTGSAPLPLPRAAGTAGAAGANAGASQGQVLTLRIEGRSGMGADQVFLGRSADGRVFQLSAGLVPGSLQIGQTLQVQVPGGTSAFQLAMPGNAVPLPTQPQAPAPGGTASSLAAAQAQTQMADADGQAARSPDLEQLLLQRLIQGQGGVGELMMLAQAWRHLVLARLRSAPGQAAPPPSTGGQPRGGSAADAAAASLTAALRQSMAADDETEQQGALFHALGAGATQQSNPALWLPSFWMFHAYAWNNTLPLTFWVLPREEEKSGGQAGRPATRARMLRLCFKHPVHGLLWVDVRVDEQHVTLDLYAEHNEAVADLLQLRPAVSAALAQAGLHLLRYQVRSGAPARVGREEAASEEQAAGSHALTSLLSAPDSTLAPELFLAAVGVMEALRTK
jgi:hypothetical protein